MSQELFTNLYGKRNTLSARVDIVNVGNLLNKDWGVGWRLVNNQPLTNAGADSQGRATYRMRNTNPTGTQHELMTTTFERTSGRADVWELGFSLSYTFN